MVFLTYQHPTLGSVRVKCASVREAKIRANREAQWGYAYPHIDDQTGTCIVGAARTRRWRGARLVWIWPRE